MEEVTYNKLESLMGNDKEMMKEMLTVFLEDMPVEIEQIKMAYAQANYSDLKAPAHK